VVGKKAQSYFNYRGYKIEETFLGVTDQPDYEQARSIAEAVRRRFEAGDFREVDLVYWRFLSAGTQEPVIRRFLPLQVDDGEGAGDEPVSDLEYEPNPTVILDELLPRYIESRIYSALLDASASEHAARQRAMKAATDNAEELKITLARVMNRARQDAITTEIMEIVGGAEALKGDKASSEELLPSLLNPAHIFPDHLDRLDQSASGH
jgi:F-type H+-transporting ATPase subunit gamma